MADGLWQSHELWSHSHQPSAMSHTSPQARVLASAGEHLRHRRRLGSFPHQSGAAPRPDRRGRHRRLERHRRRHLLRSDPRGQRGPVGLGAARRLDLRRRAGVRRRDGVRRAGDAAPARRRRVRVLARGLRPRGRVSHRVDVVCRRLLGRDRRQRRGARRLHRPVRAGRRAIARRSSACRCRACRWS